MRRRALFVSIVLLAAALLAWRRQRTRPVQGLTDAPPPAGPAAPAAPPPAPAAAAPRFVSVPWTLVAAPADRPELTLRYGGSEHMERDRVDAQETPTQVFVTVIVCWQPPAGGWFAWEREQQATVALSAPLGERELVHAPIDLERPAGADPDSPPLYP